jgi:hypothetical protein
MGEETRSENRIICARRWKRGGNKDGGVVEITKGETKFRNVASRIGKFGGRGG